MKTIKIESLAKKVYTKSEIRYINEQGWPFAIPSTAPDGSTLKYRGWDRSRTATVIEVTVTSKEMEAKLVKNFERRAKELKKRFASINVDAWSKDMDKIEQARKKAQRERDAIEAQLKADGIWNIERAIHLIRTGENTGKLTALWSKWNGIACREYEDRKNGYAKSCDFVMIRRDFTLNLRRGWHLFLIGGLVTFIKGTSIIRDGMPCEWVEQGKAIADIRTVKGYLVRGEHIEAKSLKEAKAINAEHRAMKLARLLSARKRSERRAEQKANGSLMITFQDSLNAGNCRPGTMEFKHRYEEAIGHKANQISIADLRKYGKLFGVEYYAEQAIQYALKH